MLSGLRQKSDETPKVLVVDPVAPALEYTSARLRERGFKVLTVSRPGAAEPLFELFKPDAVLLAVGVPTAGNDVLALPRRLRQLSRGQVPIIYLLEQPNDEVRDLLLNKGRGADVLAKPVNGSEVAAKLRNLIELQEATRRVERMSLEHRTPSLRDPLTELYNRRFLLALIEHEIRNCERYGGTFSLVSCAVKNLAAIRSDFGADAANAALAGMSRLILKCVRESDVAARVGEAGVVVLLPRAPAEQLPVLLARVDARLQGARTDRDPLGRAVIGMGSLSFPDVIGRPHEMLAEVVKRGRRQARAVDGHPLVPVASL